MWKENNSVQLFSVFVNKSKTELYQCFPAYKYTTGSLVVTPKSLAR
jgi:hypothetical protein